jgi:hypothetical protein
MSEENDRVQSDEYDDELRPEYDLPQLLRDAVKGKYADRYKAGTNVVVLDPDVAEAFPTAEAVNEALRLAMRLAKLQHKVNEPPNR